LQWKPQWLLEKAIESTILWYRAYRNGQNVQQMTQAQISEFAGVVLQLNENGHDF
jgi:dTDP-D-glucose 4,6-dehydratase